jgi:hypothetical protein
LLDAGVATAAPLAVAWRRSSPQAWLVTQHIPDLLDLDNIVLAQLPRLHGAQLRRAKNALLAAVARYCVQLDQLGIVHHDFKASNLLVANWDAALADIGVTPGDPYSAEQLSPPGPTNHAPLCTSSWSTWTA